MVKVEGEGLDGVGVDEVQTLVAHDQELARSPEKGAVEKALIDPVVNGRSGGTNELAEVDDVEQDPWGRGVAKA